MPRSYPESSTYYDREWNRYLICFWSIVAVGALVYWLS